MKILIFSDTHLTHKFDEAKFKYLEKIITSADQVIIAGDFWDYYLTTWTKFLSSEWSILFPLLHERNTIYLYGNHDQEYHSDERREKFSVQQGKQHHIQIKDKTLIIEHGHRIVPSLEAKYSILNNKPSLILGNKIETNSVRLLGKSFFRRAYTEYNNTFKKYCRMYLTPNQILVCGHSHLAEFNPQDKFINTGLIRYGFAQYLLIDNDNLIPVDERY